MTEALVLRTRSFWQIIVNTASKVTTVLFVICTEFTLQIVVQWPCSVV